MCVTAPAKTRNPGHDAERKSFHIKSTPNQYNFWAGHDDARARSAPVPFSCFTTPWVRSGDSLFVFYYEKGIARPQPGRSKTRALGEVW